MTAIGTLVMARLKAVMFSSKMPATRSLPKVVFSKTLNGTNG
jgi:hypothetical protein